MPSAISSTFVSISDSLVTGAGRPARRHHRTTPHPATSGDPRNGTPTGPDGSRPGPGPESLGAGGRDRGGLGPGAHAELGQHPPDVVLRGLRADVEPFADLRIRER